MLMTEAQKAKEMAAASEEERDRLHVETVEHLTEADNLAKQVSLLEKKLSKKEDEVINGSS